MLDVFEGPGWVSCFDLWMCKSDEREKRVVERYIPFHAQSVFQHFNATHEIELDVFKGPPLAFEQSDSCLANMAVRRECKGTCGKY